METNIHCEKNETFVPVWVFARVWQIEMLKESLRQEGIACYTQLSPLELLGREHFSSPTTRQVSQAVYVPANQIGLVKVVLENFPLEDMEFTLNEEDLKSSPLTAFSAPPLSAWKIIFYFLGIVLLLFLIALYLSYRFHKL
jgi:hypothetical protein